MILASGKFLETHKDHYFDNNKGETSASMRWEAFKTYSWSNNKLYQLNNQTNQFGNAFLREVNETIGKGGRQVKPSHTRVGYSQSQI